MTWTLQISATETVAGASPAGRGATGGGSRYGTLPQRFGCIREIRCAREIERIREIECGGEARFGRAGLPQSDPPHSNHAHANHPHFDRGRTHDRPEAAP